MKWIVLATATALLGACSPLPGGGYSFRTPLPVPYHALAVPNKECDVRYPQWNSSLQDNLEWHACNDDEQRQVAAAKVSADGFKRAEDEHICNGYNPLGCLSPEQKQATAKEMAARSDALECYYGSDAACQRAGGVAKGSQAAQQMLLDECLRTYTDPYATEHMVCDFVR